MEENLVPMVFQRAATRPIIIAATMPPVSTARATAPAVEEALVEAVPEPLGAVAVLPELPEAAEIAEVDPDPVAAGAEVVT
jgi:hypothetical protein